MRFRPSGFTAAMLAALAVLVEPAAVSAAPRVVASILPIHSLVAGVMEGVGVPVLIVKSTGSEHGYALKPSDARALKEADVVFWIGEDLETFLVKPLAALPKTARQVPLSATQGLTLYPNRIGGPWDVEASGSLHGKNDGPGGGATAHEAHGHEMDMHLWLDADNARRLVETMVESLSAADPANAPRYRQNGAQLIERITSLDAQLKGRLKPVAGIPYVVFHDAYQYFERRYGLAAVGSITTSPERAPSAKRLAAIRAKITQARARCAFAEPQFSGAIVRTVVEGTEARTGQLDPIGATLAPGPEAYFELLRNLAGSFLACLGPRN
ncbi:MAG: zinc ABC transporter substrate-binding protein [Alphaproteobacteria bacterium]